MPIRAEQRAKYPRNWRAISAAIRARAGDRCEWPGCDAPHTVRIKRDEASGQIPLFEEEEA